MSDVVGMAPTPTGNGYWIAEANGVVHSFGDATDFGNFAPNEFDPVTAIVTNPAAPGYRLITSLGATIPFGRRRWARRGPIRSTGTSHNSCAGPR